MKEWLEEKDLPRDCASCGHYHLNCADGYSCSKLKGKEIHCNFSEGMGYRYQDCPLQSLSEYTKQVRKEVCDEIREQICMLAYKNNLDAMFMFADNVKLNKVLEIIDQIKE